MGKRYHIEQRIKLNTFNGTWLNDGAIEVFANGVSVYKNEQAKVRTHEWATFHSIPYFNVFHGGQSAPVGPGHFDIGGMVVSKRYVGPPRSKPVALAKRFA